jgi:PAS domain S-box-containing protein
VARKMTRDERGRLPASPDLLEQLRLQEAELLSKKEELLRAQAALEDARDRYGEVFHFAPVGYLILSDAGLIDDANLTGAALLGVDRMGLAGRRFAGFVAREDSDRWQLLFPTLIRRGEWHSFRLMLQRIDGSVFPARLACEGQASREGKQVVRIVATDISEQVRTENALREAQELHGILLDETVDGYWDWSVEGGKTVVSHRAREILGPGEWGRDAQRSFDPVWRERVQPDDWPSVVATLTDLLEGRRERFEVEFRWNVHHGVWKWLRAKGRVVKRNATGRAIRVAGIITDVTHPKKLQESLQRVESRSATCAAMARNFPGGAIGLFDHNLAYVLLDGRGEVGSGAENQSLVGQLVLENYSPEHRERIEAAYGAALNGKTTEFEIAVGGRTVEVRTGPVTDAEGKIALGIVTFQVIPGRRRRSFP